MRFEYPEGSTPLDPDESEGLLVPIETQAELNLEEALSVEEAWDWVFGRKWSVQKVLDVGFLFDLHKRMFREVWDWAGKKRVTGKSIGVAPEVIWQRMRQLVDDVDYWITNETFSVQEILARFHHGLVYVHPFPNGNGRHARLATEALCLALDVSLPAWADVNLVASGDERDRYIAAVQEADGGDFGGLIEFMYPGFGDA